MRHINNGAGPLATVTVHKQCTHNTFVDDGSTPKNVILRAYSRTRNKKANNSLLFAKTSQKQILQIHISGTFWTTKLNAVCTNTGSPD